MWAVLSKRNSWQNYRFTAEYETTVFKLPVFSFARCWPIEIFDLNRDDEVEKIGDFLVRIFEHEHKNYDSSVTAAYIMINLVSWYLKQFYGNQIVSATVNMHRSYFLKRRSAIFEVFKTVI